MVAIMTAFWSVATLACAFTRNYFQLLVARAFIGIGEAGYAPAGTALLSAAYPEKKRARVMGIWNISIPVGIGIGMALGGIIAKYWGWKHAFGLVSIPGFLLAIWAWRLQDYKTVRTPESSIYREGFFANALGHIPIVPDVLGSRLSFRLTKERGYKTNDCGDGVDPGPAVSHCGEGTNPDFALDNGLKE